MAETHRSPLAERRVVVTRPAHQTGTLTALLTARGAVVHHLALVEIEAPLDGGRALTGALGKLGSYDWLVVTSANGAAAVADAVAGATLGTRPRLAAVGPASAAALGVPVDLVPDDASAEGLLTAFPHGPGTVLLAQADRAGPLLADGLRRLGWTVETCVAYRTTSVSPPADEVGRALEADAVTFASGSAVESWVEHIGTRTPPIVAVIGPATAEVAAGLHLRVDQVASDRTALGLVAALETAFDRGQVASPAGRRRPVPGSASS